jgi:hypothetical protein
MNYSIAMQYTKHMVVLLWTMYGGLLTIFKTITNYNTYTIISTIIAIIVYGIFSTTKAIIQTILVYNYEA